MLITGTFTSAAQDGEIVQESRWGRAKREKGAGKSSSSCRSGGSKRRSVKRMENSVHQKMGRLLMVNWSAVPGSEGSTASIWLDSGRA